MAGAFQSDAFQNDAFQTDAAFTGGSGQAQAWISVRTFSSGQAQASIKQTSRAYGQANAQILNPYPRYISNTSWQQDNQTSHSINIPAVEVGDLLVVVMAIDNDLSTTTSLPAGWTKLREDSDGDGFVHGAVFYKLIDTAAAATTITVTHSTSQACAGTVLLIRNGAGIESSAAGGNDNLPNPPNLTPTWGSAATLWLAFYAIDSWIDFTSQPSGYTHIQNGRYPDVGEGVSYGVSYKRATAASENPGTFTLGQSQRWAAFTIGIQPAGATSRYAQAQAHILTTVNNHAQSQADIKATSNAVAQSQADIKQTYQQYGQAQAHLANVYQQYGQSQAQLIGYPTQSAQAQALITAPARAYGQARARIGVIVIKDTFTRTSSGVLTDPDVGPSYPASMPWGVFGSYNQHFSQSEIDGSQIVTTGSGEYDWVDVPTNTAIFNFVIQIDFKFNQVSDWATVGQVDNGRLGSGAPFTTWVEHDADDSLHYIRIRQSNGVTRRVSVGLLSANTWYTLKMFGSGPHNRVKLWATGAPEPDWQLEELANDFHTFGFADFYADDGETPGTIVYFDNFILLSLDQESSYGSGQAQASIVNKISRSAQARAWISVRTNRSAQARAVVINPKWAQAQAWILAHPYAHGQAQAYILEQISYVTGQAQAKIHRYEGYGQAQALIDSTRGYFQALAFIDYLWQLDTVNALYFRASGTTPIVGGIVYSRDIAPGTVRVDWNLNMNSASDFAQASIYIEAAGIESRRYSVNRTNSGTTYTFFLDVYDYAQLHLRFDYNSGGLLTMAAHPGSTVIWGYPKEGYWKLSEPNANAYSQSVYGPTGYYSTSGITYQVATTIANNPLGVTVAGAGSVSYPLDAALDTFTAEIWFKTSDTISGIADSYSSFGYPSQLTTNTNYIIVPQYRQGFDAAGLVVGTNGVAIVGYGNGGLYQLAHYYASISSAKWHHVAMVFNQRYTFLYLDGALVHAGLRAANSTFRPSILFSMTSDDLGQISSSAFYNGSAAGFKVYDRALTAQEIKSSYESGLPRGYGQAQAIIKNPWAWAQAQAYIIKTQQFGQANAKIAPGFGSGSGQAVAQIYRYEGYGQAQGEIVRQSSFISAQTQARINPISEPQYIYKELIDAQTYNWTHTEGYIWVDQSTFRLSESDTAPDPVFSGINPPDASFLDNYGWSSATYQATAGYVKFTLDRRQFVIIDTLNYYPQFNDQLHDTVIGILTGTSTPGNWTTVQAMQRVGLIRGGNDDVTDELNQPTSLNNFESRFQITLDAGTYIVLVGFYADSGPYQANLHFYTNEPPAIFQALATISTTGRRSGQAQAFIRQPNKYGQASVINKPENTLVYVDAFDRIVSQNSTGWGTSTHFGTYSNGGGNNTYGVVLNGFPSVTSNVTGLIYSQQGTIPLSAYGAAAWEARWTFLMPPFSSTLDIISLTLASNTTNDVVSVSLERLLGLLRLSRDGTFFDLTSVSAPVINQGTRTTLAIKYDFTTGTMYGKVYANDSAEPDWMVTLPGEFLTFADGVIFVGATIQNSFFALSMTGRPLQMFAYFFVGQSAQAAAMIVGTVQNQYGQAQGTITVVSNKYGQARAIINQSLQAGLAQAKILGTSRVSAQAQAKISTTNKHGQARARIKGKPTQSGQAQARIRFAGGSFQARAVIRYTWKHAQARAKIIEPHPTRSAQAQAKMDKVIYSPTGQAMAQISLTVRVGQAMAFIGTFKSFQAQALIRQLAQQKRFQAQGNIKAKSNAYGQANALIVREVTNKFGQAQGRIVSASTKSGQACAEIMSPHPCRFAQAAGKITGMSGQTRYLVRYEGWQLPGYAQSEGFDSDMEIDSAYTGIKDGSLSEELGLKNKIVELRLKAVAESYRDVKDMVQLATTIVRSARGWAKLYVQREDRYFLVLTRQINFEHGVSESSRSIDYTVQFEAKPWIYGTDIQNLAGTTSIVTTGRTLDDGGWTPTQLTVTGTNVTISGYTEYGQFAGFISISGAVTNLRVDTDQFIATMNGQNAERYINNKDYKLYVGPGVTTFDIDGATDVEISYQNRWYL